MRLLWLEAHAFDVSPVQCVMEIFTFLNMGGDLSRVTVVPLATDQVVSAASESGSTVREVLTAQFAQFDAEKAECYLPEDKQRLLAVIESAFGDFGHFNELVRAVFAAQVTRNTSWRLSLRVSARDTETPTSPTSPQPAAEAQPECV